MSEKAAKSTIQTAKPAAARTVAAGASRPLRRAEPLLPGGDSNIRKRAAIGPVVIQAEPKPEADGPWLRGPLTWAGLLVIGRAFLNQDAPAWLISMAAHAVVLIVLALVNLPEQTPYRSQPLVVGLPTERKFEEVANTGKSVSNELLDTTEYLPGEGGAGGGGSTTGRGGTKGRSSSGGKGGSAGSKSAGNTAKTAAGETNPQRGSAKDGVSNELDAAPAAVETIDPGLALGNTPKDLVNIVGAFGNAATAAVSAGPDINHAEVGKKPSLQREGGTLASEKAVTGAMRWLANHQLPDGSWSFDHFESPTCHSQCRNPGKLRDARFAATGFALLPYIGAGQTHKAGKYKATVRNGLYYLINHMKVTARGGALNDPGGNMYSHGICTIALCEAYAVSHDKALLVPAQQAVNFICWAQDPVHGGWRYQPREPGDTSVLGWQLMALKSAYMANLRVPAIAVRRASNFLDFVQLDSGARYGYTSPSVVNTDATTAIGVLCRMYLGWKRDSIPLQRGVEYISSRGPSVGNLYFNYYGTQVMRHWEGEEWKKWNRAMRDQLAHGQTAQGHEDGSWYVNGADQGADAGGRVYCTSMAAIILEVYYRSSPIYRSQSIEQDFPE